MKIKKLDLNEFFSVLETIPYVLVKKSKSFPDYHTGQDADIFCYNKREVVRKILGVGNGYLSDGYVIKTEGISPDHCQVDFVHNNVLVFKFDIFTAFPEYEKLSIKNHYFNSIIEGAVGVKCKFRDKKYHLYVPSSVDDLLIRYFEYLEYYDRRPDKLKHLDYILNAIEKTGKMRIGFFDKLHIYTEFPESNMSTSRYKYGFKIKNFLHWLVPLRKRFESLKHSMKFFFK